VESQDRQCSENPEAPAQAGAIPFLTRRQTALFAALVVLVLLVGNAGTSLWDQDEAAYAGFARTMLRSGDWLVPHFTWSEVHRKTPLLFWCIAASFAFFGENEFALRLPTALAVLLTLVSVATIGRPVFGGRVAPLAAAILATMVFIPNLGKVAVTDSLVLLFETLAALAMIRVMSRGSAERAWPWTLLFWTSVALGTLAKGPVILIFAGGLGAWLTVFHPQRRQLLLGLQPWFFLPLALVPIGIWGWLAWERTDGELITWMIDWYVMNRFNRPPFNQTGPPGYYLVSFLITMLPWAFFLPAALVRVWQHRKEPVYCVLAGWLLSGWVVWEFAASKLPSYAIGAYPAFALLFAYEILDLNAAALWRRPFVRFGARLAVVVSMVISFALLAGAAFFLNSTRLAFAASLPAALLTITPVWAMARLRAGNGDVQGAVRVLLFGTVAFLVATWTLLIPQLESMRSMSPQIAQTVASEAPPGAQVVIGGNFQKPSLPFYLGKSEDPLVIDESGLAELICRQDSVPQVLVLNDHGYLGVRQTAKTHDWRPVRVRGFDFDRGREATFWVLVRNPPTHRPDD
jgi:4-amino-4-deoxy-L-arabinose transferase-like glycosyltransferase